MSTQKYQPSVLTSTKSQAGTALQSKAGSGLKKSAHIKRIWTAASKTLKGQFIVLSFGGLFLALVLTASVVQAFQRANSDLDTINNGSIPSVNAAQTLAQYIEDIDAKSADYLATGALSDRQPCSIVGTNSTAPMTVHDCDNVNIEAEIQLANRELFNAAHNVTYPGERTAVERITRGFEEYIANIALMRYEYTRATTKGAVQDPHLQAAYKAYQDASALLHQKIGSPILSGEDALAIDESSLPTCVINGHVLAGTAWARGSIEDNITCLNNINKSHLDAAYDDTLKFLDAGKLLAFFLCAIFCLYLLFTAGKMAFATHRIMNIGLSIAFLTGVILSIAVSSLFLNLSGRHGAFGQMVKDDYDSIYAAALLKRYGTAANGDESRWLIALEFGDKTGSEHWAQDWQANLQQVEHLMTQARANRTWPEEDQPLTDMQANWQRYVAIDGHMRNQAQDIADPQRIIHAEALSTGASNNTFDQFSQAVDRLSKANANHYTTTYASTQLTLLLYIMLSLLLFPLASLLALWGIWLRLKDF
ncbi:tetratricopeptide repeat protein [Ktedonosporobacter rubrisoli]|uniref:Tetratricopeptide repeat protein n=1 Tax=Ktedonosporobacter rubrisoli TaxID=2509675 RepID=A0A4P6JVU5_KTERU|nr:tetratricopeptide repeat protein [Ktedonosporobacter rubrisoli]QBD79798.1 tetratricopeptide repeat protein [Ktedonosporobacter rubrisoli]